MNFVLTFFAYGMLKQAMETTFGPDSVFNSPFWFVAEGAVVGLIIGYYAIRFGSEGVETSGR